MECSWCGTDFEPEGKEQKCEQCRSRKAYTKDFLPQKGRMMRLSRPSKQSAMRTHASRP